MHWPGTPSAKLNNGWCDGTWMKNASYALAAETCISHTLTKVLRLASVFIKRDLRSKQALLDRPRWFMFMVAVGGNSKGVVSRGVLRVIGLLRESS